MQESKYLGVFAEARKHFKMFGGKVLVERLEVGEVKSAGGIILSAPSNVRTEFKHAQPLVCMVLAVGEGYTDDEGVASIPPSVEPGNVIVVNTNGVSFFSTIPGITSYSNMSIGICVDSDVQLKFNNLEAYEAYAASLQTGT